MADRDNEVLLKVYQKQYDTYKASIARLDAEFKEASSFEAEVQSYLDKVVVHRQAVETRLNHEREGMDDLLQLVEKEGLTLTM